MLRIHFLLRWFTFSDPFIDQMLIDTSSIRGMRPLDSGALLLQQGKSFVLLGLHASVMFPAK
jgi:hypothetical protein